MLSSRISNNLAHRFLASTPNGSDVLCDTNLESNNKTLPLANFVNNLEQVRKLSIDLPWLTGENFNTENLGSAGRMIATCSSLGEAIDAFTHCFPIWQSATEVSVDYQHRQLRWSYRILDPNIWPRRGDAELTLGVMFSICRLFGMHRSDLSKVCFEHNADAETKFLARKLSLPVCFGGETNCISFSTRLLEKRKPYTAAELQAHIALRQSVEAELKQLKESAPLTHFILEILFKKISRRQPSQEQVADMLGISDRSLRRALASEGRHYKDILEECRRVQAVALLGRPKLPISDIAFMLGYSDQTAFSRAFSKWFGMPPRALRQSWSEKQTGQ